MEVKNIGFSFPQNMDKKNKEIKSILTREYVEDYFCDSKRKGLDFDFKKGDVLYSQSITKNQENVMKVIDITKNFDTYKNVQQYNKDGFFSSVRLKNNEIINSYRFKPYEKVLANKYSEGLKGLMEEFINIIVNDKNGCERLFVRNLLAKIKK